ncbi:MAG: choice-of-anchor D domain-containing protein, partial [Lentisphaerota bacterium]
MHRLFCSPMRLVWIVLFILALAGTTQAEFLAGWSKVNSATNADPYYATQRNVKLDSAAFSWKSNFYKYNDNSWFYIEPFCTNDVLTPGVSATNQSTKANMPITNYMTFVFQTAPGYKVSFTNMVFRGLNDERRLHFYLRSSSDGFVQDAITASTDHPTTQLVPRSYCATTNSFRTYTNVLNLVNVTNRPVELRLYGMAGRSQWVYWYMTNVWGSGVGAASNYMIYFEGKVERMADFLPPSGPLAGGNVILLTNACEPPIGNGSDITNVRVGTANITSFHGQGTNWVSWTMPPGDSAGAKDVTVYSVSTGMTVFTEAYTYISPGVIFDNVSAGWYSKASMPSPLYSMGYGMWSNSLYVVGGYGSQESNTVFRYDGGTNWVTCASLPYPRSSSGIFSLGAYLFCAAGSCTGWGQSAVYRYDGSSWTTVNPVPTVLRAFGCAVLNGSAYLMGGVDASATQVDTVYRFDGVNWTTSTALPATRYCCFAATLGNTLYLMGGILSGGAQTSSILKFDGTNWTSAGNLPVWRYEPAVCVQSNKILIIGGKDSSYSSVTNIYAFDGTNWTEQLGLGSVLSAEAAGVVSNRLYVAGGSPLSSDTRYYRVSSTGVTPVSDTSAGGAAVTIMGLNLGNGSDITNVTLCGIPAAIQPGQTATSVTAIAGASGGPLYGDVCVYSSSQGETVKSNYFQYNYNGPLFALYTDSTNWTYYIPSGAAPTSTYKTAFGTIMAGQVVTSELTVSEDSGSYAMNIGTVQVTGAGAAAFMVSSMPSSLESYGYSNFFVRFAPPSAGLYTASVSIANDGYPNPFILNVAGTALGTDPDIAVLGTNGAVIANGAAAQSANGTRFPMLRLGASWTNTFRLTNSGAALLTLSGYSLSDPRFAVVGMPAEVSEGGVSNFSVVFTPDVAGACAAALIISNNSPTAAYTVNLAGSCYALSTNVGPYAGGNTITITNGS